MKIDDTLWYMAGESYDDCIIWHSESIEIMDIDKFNWYVLSDMKRINDYCIGRSYYLTQEELENDFENRWKVKKSEQGTYKTMLIKIPEWLGKV